MVDLNVICPVVLKNDQQRLIAIDVMLIAGEGHITLFHKSVDGL